jgi:hypothetical protein
MLNNFFRREFVLYTTMLNSIPKAYYKKITDPHFGYNKIQFGYLQKKWLIEFCLTKIK